MADGLQLDGLVRPTDRAMGNRLSGLGGVGAGLSYRRDPLNYDPFTTGRVAGNVVRGFGTGASLFTSGKPLVTANTFEGNDVGIVAEDNARITRNVVRGNGDGIRMCFTQQCGSVLVRDNRVTGSERRGIWVLQGHFPAFPMLIQANRVSGSGELDCVDESVEPTAPRPSYWSGNIGTTDVPASLCRPG
jgi:Right handed beta helix region